MSDKNFKRMHKSSIQIELNILERDIVDYGRETRKYTDWITYLGISLSCFANLLVADFKEAFSIKAEQWKTIFVLITVVFGIMTLIRGIQNLSNTEKVCRKKMMEQIRRDACSPNEDRILFLLIRNIPNEKPKVLVYRDLIWDCWFLPNKHRSGANENSIRSYIADEIGVSVNAVSIELFSDNYDLCTRKMSQNFLEITDYFNKFCFVKIKETVPHLCEDEFEISGRSYQWMSTTEMLSNDEIREKNADIVQYIHDNYNTFLYQRNSLHEEKEA